MTTWAENTRFAASGMTRLLGESMTSSETIMLRRTGRQCRNCALSVTAMCFASTVHPMSLLSILP